MASSSTNTTFKAIRVNKFGDEKVLELEDCNDFSTIGAKEAVVRVEAVGINPVDTYIRTGTYVRKPSLPYTPGADCAGIVERVGSDLSAFKVGDRVYCTGTLTGSYAQKALVNESQLHSLPERLTFAQGAALNVPYATAYRALHVRGGLVAGESVLVHGASGGVGIAAVQLAKAFGCRVVGTAGTAEGLKLVKAQGADQVFNHREDGYEEKIKQAFEDNGGADVILEMLANVNLEKDIQMLARKGRVMVIGNRGSIEINPRGLMAKEADVRGVALAHSTPEQKHQIFAGIQAGLENGTLQPVVGAQMPLADAPKAHKDIIETRRLGKLVLIPW
mmetsp:Transcript_8348/g.12694  ORF Transcript_8348/g.12694 Transcript_8348/m.12694 type:complete len:333 (-) Transcript_8348:59-1057(-)